MKKFNSSSWQDWYFCLFAKNSAIKTIASIVLTFLLLFQSAGWYVCHYAQVQHVRHEMKQRLKHSVPQELRVLLKIPFSMEEGHPDFQRIHEGEFRYKGEMYDILKSEVHGSETWYTCIHDVKESGLFKDLDQLISFQLHKDSDERRHHNLMGSFFSKQFIANASPYFKEVAPFVSQGFWFNQAMVEAFGSRPWKPPCPVFYNTA